MTAEHWLAALGGIVLLGIVLIGFWKAYGPKPWPRMGAAGGLGIAQMLYLKKDTSEGDSGSDGSGGGDGGGDGGSGD